MYFIINLLQNSSVSQSFNIFSDTFYSALERVKRYRIPFKTLFKDCSYRCNY